MNMRLDGRVAVVTGAGNGLGRALAIDLAARGARVLVNNRTRVVDDGVFRADAVVREIIDAGGEAVASYDDALDPQTGERIVELALETWGRLDLCVANAGVMHSGERLYEQPLEDVLNMVQINLLGPIYLLRAVYPEMVRAGYGRIVIIGSTAGLHGSPMGVGYSATKGATVSLGRALAVEAPNENILVNVVLPYAGGTQTMSKISDERTVKIPAEAVAPVVAALLTEECTLRGEIVLAGGGKMRRTAAVQWPSVDLPDDMTSEQFVDLVARSGSGAPMTFPSSFAGFEHFLAELGD